MEHIEMFDFNAIEQPTLPTKLGELVVHLSYPSVELIDRVEALGAELQSIADKKDGRTLRATYGLIAEVLSCNEDGFTFTAEELRDKYKMTLYGVAKFMARYFDFIKKANEAKN